MNSTTLRANSMTIGTTCYITGEEFSTVIDLGDMWSNRCDQLNEIEIMVTIECPVCGYLHDLQIFPC